jgi:hypothetical protein
VGRVIEFRNNSTERRRLLEAIGDLSLLISKTADPVAKAGFQAHVNRYAERLEALDKSDPKAKDRK